MIHRIKQSGSISGGVCLVGLILVCSVRAQSNYLAESERKAREVIQKGIQALGGEAYLKAKDLTRTGKAFQLKGEELKGLLRVTIMDKYPDKTRSEYGNQDIVYINSGDKGWKIEYKNVKDQTVQELEDFRVGRNHSLDFILRNRLEEDGLRFRYMGKMRMEMDDAEIVQLIDKTQDKIKIYFSSTTGLPIKMEYQTPGHGNRWTSDDERLFFNYHTVSGIQVPFGMVRNSNGYKVSDLTLESVKVDTGLSDDLFTPVLRKK
jgi:hypothetical protein